jgi:hypothetical protein
MKKDFTNITTGPGIGFFDWAVSTQQKVIDREVIDGRQSVVVVPGVNGNQIHVDVGEVDPWWKPLMPFPSGALHDCQV